VPSTTTDQISALARAIRVRRKQLEVTQEELAALAGVSPRFIGQLEGGKPTVRLSAFLSVCSALGLKVALQ
jgi:y4mF family transcriptional regulator